MPNETAPQLGLNRRILESIANRKPVSLTLNELAAGCGARQRREIILYANWRSGLSAIECA